MVLWAVLTNMKSISSPRSRNPSRINQEPRMVVIAERFDVARSWLNSPTAMTLASSWIGR